MYVLEFTFSNSAAKKEEEEDCTVLLCRDNDSVTTNIRKGYITIEMYKNT